MSPQPKPEPTPVPLSPTGGPRRPHDPPAPQPEPDQQIDDPGSPERGSPDRTIFDENKIAK